MKRIINQRVSINYYNEMIQLQVADGYIYFWWHLINMSFDRYDKC